LELQEDNEELGNLSQRLYHETIELKCQLEETEQSALAAARNMKRQQQVEWKKLEYEIDKADKLQ
jgi:hypothetical protein